MPRPHGAARSASAQVYVDDLGVPELLDADRHHLQHVLRLRPGEVVLASDGRGGWVLCRWSPGKALEVAGPAARTARPGPPLTVALAVPKGERADWAVQKLTEVGVDRIVPLVTRRSVVRWPPERAARQVERWRAIARSASGQSRRLWLPEVEAPSTLGELLAAAGVRSPEGAGVAATGWSEPPEGGSGAIFAEEPDRHGGRPDASPAPTTTLAVALADPGGPPPDLDHPTVAIGPEGGWDDEELQAAPATVGLGASVLRTETAAVVTGALLVALRAGIVAPAGGPGMGRTGAG